MKTFLIKILIINFFILSNLRAMEDPQQDPLNPASKELKISIKPVKNLQPIDTQSLAQLDSLETSKTIALAWLRYIASMFDLQDQLLNLLKDIQMHTADVIELNTANYEFFTAQATDIPFFSDLLKALQIRHSHHSDNIDQKINNAHSLIVQLMRSYLLFDVKKYTPQELTKKAFGYLNKPTFKIARDLYFLKEQSFGNEFKNILDRLLPNFLSLINLWIHIFDIFEIHTHYASPLFEEEEFLLLNNAIEGTLISFNTQASQYKDSYQNIIKKIRPYEKLTSQALFSTFDIKKKLPRALSFSFVKKEDIAASYQLPCMQQETKKTPQPPHSKKKRQRRRTQRKASQEQEEKEEAEVHDPYSNMPQLPPTQKQKAPEPVQLCSSKNYAQRILNWFDEEWIEKIIPLKMLFFITLSIHTLIHI